jgi:hypothetical protein
LALYGAFGGTLFGRTWTESVVLCMRVVEGFGVVIPTWPPEAEARLGGIGAEGEMAVGVGVDPQDFSRDAYEAGMQSVNDTIVRLSLVAVPTRCKK